MNQIDKADLTVEVRCPVDRILFFECIRTSSGKVDCYCRRCKTYYEVELPFGVPKRIEKMTAEPDSRGL